MTQPGFFDWQFRYEKLDATGDPLVQLNKVIKWERFRSRLEEIREKFVKDVDLILSEGYKKDVQPKIEIFRKEKHRELLCTKEDQLVANVSDKTFRVGVPCFNLDDMKRPPRVVYESRDMHDEGGYSLEGGFGVGLQAFFGMLFVCIGTGIAVPNATTNAGAGFDQAVVTGAGGAVCRGQLAPGQRKIVVDVHAIHGVAIQHATVALQPVFRQSVGRCVTCGQHVAVGIDGRTIAASIPITLPQRELALCGQFLYACILRVYQVRILGPQEQHAVSMNLLDHALQFGGRRTRHARMPQSVHLEERETKLRYLRDLDIARLRMLTVADPHEHPQIASAGLWQTVGCNGQTHTKGKRLPSGRFATINSVPSLRHFQ